MISIMVTIKPDWGGLVLSTLNLLIYHHSTGPRFISNVFKSIKRFCVLAGDCINSERAAESPEAAGRSVALLFNLILNLRRAADERRPLSCVSQSSTPSWILEETRISAAPFLPPGFVLPERRPGT